MTLYVCLNVAMLLKRKNKKDNFKHWGKFRVGFDTLPRTRIAKHPPNCSLLQSFSGSNSNFTGLFTPSIKYNLRSQLR